MRSVLRPLVALLVIFAQTAIVRGDPLRVASVRNQKPFSQLSDGQWNGFAINLWQKIAEANHWQYTIVPFDNEDAAVDALAAKQVDVLASATSITASRLDHVAFSLPYFRTGLQIMIVESRPYTLSRLREDLSYIARSGLLWLLAGVVFLMTIVVFLVERWRNPNSRKGWRHGMTEAFYYVVAVGSTASSRRALPDRSGRLRWRPG